MIGSHRHGKDFLYGITKNLSLGLNHFGSFKKAFTPSTLSQLDRPSSNSKNT